MKAGNASIMAVAAVVVALCLLFSWVYLDDPASDDDAGRETFDGMWYPVYESSVGDDIVITEPEMLVATDDGSVVTLTDGESTREYVKISDREAVGSSYASQLYLEDGMLYMIYISADSDFPGMLYVAMTQDPDADVDFAEPDLIGLLWDVELLSTNGYEVRDARAGSIEITDHTDRIASGTVSVENTDSRQFHAFVKEGADRTVLIGFMEDSANCRLFSCVIEGGEVMFSIIRDDSLTGIASLASSSGFPEAPSGHMSVETTDGALDVAVTGDRGLFMMDLGVVGAPGVLTWSLEGEYVLSGFGSLALWNGDGYELVVNNMVR